MLFDTDGNITIVLQEKVSLQTFLKNLKEAYPRFRKNHLIINLFSLGKLGTDDILEFLELSNSHRAEGRSFVLVSDTLSYNDLPDEICAVPTLQEARDIVEMEEIERDLDL